MLEKSIFFTVNSSQTKKAGEILAKEALKTKHNKKALVIGLVGDLGSGKTTFLQGFARGLKIKEQVLSPTFIIMRKLSIPSLAKQKQPFKRFFHIDCYRVEKTKELLELGFKKNMEDPENIVVLEWADKAMDILPRGAIMLKIDFIGREKRRFKCTLKN